MEVGEGARREPAAGKVFVAICAGLITIIAFYFSTINHQPGLSKEQRSGHFALGFAQHRKANNSDNKFQDFCMFDSAERSYACVPRFHLIGPSKCGTTTMAFALNKHPMLVGLEDYENVKDESNNLKAPLMLSLLEHEDFFQKVPISEINGGKLPTVFYYKPNAISDPVVPMHMVEWHHFLHVSGFKFDTTQMRFVVMLREPVSRAYSSWSFRVQVGTEHRSWEQTVQQNLKALSAWTSCLAQHNITRHSVLESCHIQKFGSGASSIYDEHFMKSVYSIQLKYWLLFFHPSQFHIVFMEDFIQEPLEAFEGVLRFAGLELLDKNGQTGFPDRVTALRLVTTVSNPTKKTEKNSALLTEETQTMLSSFFEDFNEQLAEIVGLCFTPYHSHERRRSLWQGTWTTEVISSSIGAQSNVPWLFLDEPTNSSRRCRG